VGGSFSAEGNASGTILACEPPHTLRVTWGDPSSIVEIRLSAEGGGTTFVLDHEVPLAMAGSGAGAFFVGPGWDGAVAALGLFLAGDDMDAVRAASETIEGQEMGRTSIRLWAPVVEASGTATPEQMAEGLAVALAQYAPDLTDPAG
jgi:hypothetical protein